MQSISKEAIESHLTTRVFGHPLTVVETAASTNDAVRRLGEQHAPEGAAVAANRQEAGRGRRGRSFFSPEGGVYLSILLRPKPEAAGLITSAAAVAVARAIESLVPATVGIKWVNDLWLNGKKVCGILAEGVPGDEPSVALGIGVNVAGTSFPPQLQGIATSLEAEGYEVDRNALIAAILREWEALYPTVASGDFLGESRRRSVVLGKELRIIQGECVTSGVGVDLDEAGHLIVEAAGERRTLSSGEVSVRLPGDPLPE